MSTQLAFIVVAVAALAAESGGSFADSFGDVYCKIEPRHALCLKTKPCAAAASDKYRAIDDAGIKVLLDAHNELRSRVAKGLATAGINNTLLPPAANMLRMTWDPELAEIAQAHTNNCHLSHDCARCRSAKNNRFWWVGQNGFISGFGSPDGNETPDFGGVVKAWYSEMGHFENRNLIDHYEWQHSTAHATQIIWAHSHKVGCGYIVFKEGSGYKQIIFCNYGYGANAAPLPIYVRGAPCSKCDWLSTCDKDSLCSWDT